MGLETIAAIITLGAMEIALILTGEDGQFMLPIVAAISGLGGYQYGKTRK